MSDPLEEAVRQAVRERFESHQVPLLRRLVEQPSCTRDREDVEAAMALLEAEATAIGLRVEKVDDPSGKYAAHRIFSTPALEEGARAPLMVGHMDTVFPRELGFFGFVREGEVARGPGVLDMKSGLSSVIGALAALREAAPEAFAALRLRFVCNSDEEVGSPSSAPLFAALAEKSAYALVFESGREEDRIVVARKGSANYAVTAHGRSAHAGNAHEEGVSAVWALSLLVPLFEGMTDYARGRTVNVGLFSGGTAKNTVPDRARCELDVRFVEAADADAFDRRLRALIQDPWSRIEAPARLREATFSLEGGLSRPPMEATEASRALRAAYERHAEAAGLSVGEAPLQGGGSDANLLARAGVPCIDGLGPYGQHFHRTDEWASLRSLRRRTEALATFVLGAALLEDPDALPR